MLVRHFAGDLAWHASERGLHDGSVALRDVLQTQASYVRGRLPEVAALLRSRVRIDPTFLEFVEFCRSRAMPVSVVSSGIEPIIRGRLADLGLADLPVIANAVDDDPTGWHIRFRDGTANGTDKAALVKAAVGRGVRTIYIGDGRSDYAAALAADLRFARRGFPLATYLTTQLVEFEEFDSFMDVMAHVSVLQRSRTRPLT